MMKNSCCQFSDWLSGFVRQSEKFSHIGACIGCNFTPCIICCHFSSCYKTSYSKKGLEGPHSESKFVAFFSCLMQPFKFYPLCTEPSTSEVSKVVGTLIHVTPAPVDDSEESKKKLLVPIKNRGEKKGKILLQALLNMWRSC